MRTSDECLQQAKHAEQLAVKATDPSSKAVLLEIARGWRELAVKDTRLAESAANDDEIETPANSGG